MKRTLFFLLLACALGCGDDDTSATDTGAADTGAADGGADTGEGDTDVADTNIDTGAADAGGDTGADLRTTVMTATFGDTTEPFSLAYFGRNLDGTFHVEVYGDPIDEVCPTMETPSPARSLVLGSFASPLPAEQDLAAAVLFDFRGTLTDAPLLRFTSGTQNGLTWSLMGEDDDEMSIAVDIAFPGGTVTGRFYATHCDSMDEPMP